MSTALLIRHDSTLTASVAPEAHAALESALALSALIGTVKTAEQQVEAVEAQRALKTIISEVEKSRKAIKQPVIDYGRNIDRTAEEFVKEATEELSRVSGAIGDFQQLEQKRVMAAEAAARLEQRRIEDERRAREDAERARLAEEQRKIQAAADEARRVAAAKQAEIDEAAARKLAEARNARERQLAADQAKRAEAARIEFEEKQRLAQIEIDRQKAQAEAASHEALDKINTEADKRVREEIQPVTAARVEGQKVSQDWDIDVTSPQDLARCHPGCVKIVPLLTEIKAALNAGVTLAGVRAKRKTVATVRATPQPKLIEV